MRQIARIAADQPPTRNLLSIAAMVLMVIVGLLGMHTLSAGASGHGTMMPAQHHNTVTAHVAVSSDPAPVHHGAPVSTPQLSMAAFDVGAATDTGMPVSHDEMLLACVLALLVGLVLFFAPQLMGGVFRPVAHRAAISRLAGTSIRPRPPSLIFLSISRT